MLTNYSRVSVEAGKQITSDAYDRFRKKIKDGVQAVQAVETKIKAAKKAGGDTEEYKHELEEAQSKLEWAFDYLMRHDKFSMRDYLMNVE
jgi:hypothetical protein